ncbi:HTTM domain-containing protein [Streptomyces sp. SID8379]|uniref:HTTM domain-containing protein n=1 Tax=unclassified Streptomyces TaxID=2593676 RepID=UPI00037A7886|nr:MULTISPECIES: HTTM domain-containing protein [unclassified Streptomyces]MYW68900.1 HTTM domain-containing protein [Streptomyces sp. SID8379]
MSLAEKGAPRGLGGTLSAGVQRITGSALGPYQSAVVRIGFSATWLLFLLREFPHRQELYGPDGPWSWNLAQQLIANNHAFTALLWSDDQAWFEFVYIAAMVASALLMLGWRTRTTAVLFMIGVLSLQNRSVFMGDGGDNVIHLMSIYLVFTRCGQVWSLDARRAARARAGQSGRFGTDRVGPALWWVVGLALSAITFTGKVSGGWLLFFWALWAVHGVWWFLNQRFPQGDPRLLGDVVANLAHNAALLVVMVEACLIYATAGWYKIQGTRWQDGTAVYYPLHLDYFSPWPALGDLLSAYGPMVMLVTYGTVAVQVAFPFTVFNRRVKNVLLVLMIIEHTFIAVALGLPFFSLAMIAADAVFLPTSFLRRVGGWAARARDRVLPARAASGTELPEQRRAEQTTGTEQAGAEEGAEPLAADPSAART